MKKLIFLCMMISCSSVMFAQKYAQYISEARKYEDQKRWCYAMGAYFDAVEAYPAAATKETRREKIASSLNSYLTNVPPSRLLTLLQQALAYEKEKGLLVEGERLDIFHNTIETTILEDAIPTVKV